MKSDRAKCPIFWLISDDAVVDLIKYQHDHFKSKISEPPEQDTSSKWEAPETSENIEKIMQERPRHVRKVG